MKWALEYTEFVSGGDGDEYNDDRIFASSEDDYIDIPLLCYRKLDENGDVVLFKDIDRIGDLCLVLDDIRYGVAEWAIDAGCD